MRKGVIWIWGEKRGQLIEGNGEELDAQGPRSLGEQEVSTRPLCLRSGCLPRWGALPIPWFPLPPTPNSLLRRGSPHWSSRSTWTGTPPGWFRV